jgi:aspartyl-tRNA(Asn)/glutamyl-tRNA(Gln) amidotransferase subunit C
VKITKAEVEYVAGLARLEFSEEGKEMFATQLNSILSYMDMLNRVDTSGVEPETHAISLKNAFREDGVWKSLDPEEATKNAPEERGNCFRVPKVIE